MFAKILRKILKVSTNKRTNNKHILYFAKMSESSLVFHNLNFAVYLPIVFAFPILQRIVCGAWAKLRMKKDILASFLSFQFPAFLDRNPLMAYKANL